MVAVWYRILLMHRVRAHTWLCPRVPFHSVCMLSSIDINIFPCVSAYAWSPECFLTVWERICCAQQSWQYFNIACADVSTLWTCCWAARCRVYMYSAVWRGLPHCNITVARCRKLPCFGLDIQRWLFLLQALTSCTLLRRLAGRGRVDVPHY